MSGNGHRVMTLSEWDTRDLSGYQLTDADRVLARQFSGKNSRKLLIEEMRDCVRVRTKSWIGVVRLDSVEFRIEPKLAGENIRVVEMLEFTTGIDLLKRFKKSHTLPMDQDNLFDLIALLLIEEAEWLVRNGLLSDYETREDLLTVVRGRLLPDRQVLQRFGQIDRIHCSFDEITQNIVENQIVAAALEICERAVSSPGLRRRARMCLYDFLSCCDPRHCDLRDARQRVIYDRLNQHYRDVHHLSWLVLDQLGVTDIEASGKTSCFSFLLNMNQLFEQFVSEALKRILEPTRLRVKPQVRDGSIIRNAATNRPYASVIPDALVGSGDRLNQLPVDAKYKRFDEFKVGSADIYQAFIYAFAYGHVETARNCVLVYPCSDEELVIDCLRIRSASAADTTVTVLGVHIPTLLDELHHGSNPTLTDSLRENIVASTPVHS